MSAETSQSTNRSERSQPKPVADHTARPMPVIDVHNTGRRVIALRDGARHAIDQAATFLRAVASARLTDEQTRTRLEACRTCPARVTKDGHDYCNDCGCPKSNFWPAARLANKARMSAARCSRGRWSQSPIARNPTPHRRMQPT